MAISLGTALLGSAVIGAGASIIGGNKQAKAAKDAAVISQEDNAANRAFLTDIYNRNVGFISPFWGAGVTANNAVMALLGYPQTAPTTSAFANYPAANNIPALNGAEPAITYNPTTGQYELASGTGGVPGAVTTTLPSIPGVSAPDARSAFDNYRGYTGYDFRFNEGTRALQSAFSRNLESGAAAKSAIRFGQGIASDEFGRYVDLLRGQAGMGLTGASALAGVGTQFGNTVTAGNTAAANAAANARLYAGNVAANNWANIGSSFGTALGAFAKPGGWGI